MFCKFNPKARLCTNLQTTAQEKSIKVSVTQKPMEEKAKRNRSTKEDTSNISVIQEPVEEKESKRNRSKEDDTSSVSVIQKPLEKMKSGRNRNTKDDTSECTLSKDTVQILKVLKRLMQRSKDKRIPTVLKHLIFRLLVLGKQDEMKCTAQINDR